MTPEYVLRRSLCRAPHCAGPHDRPFEQWTDEERNAWKRRAESEIECMEYASEYGEPGYDNPGKGILFANWNYFPRGVDDLLEKMGYAIEWSDEWQIVPETGKAYRTSPNGYDWQPYYWIRENDCEIIGGDEIENDENIRDEYVEHLTNNPRHCNLFNIDFESLGWTRHNGEFGFHAGMNDNPETVFEELKNRYDVIFDARGGSSQFYVSWRVWIREKELETVEERARHC